MVWTLQDLKVDQTALSLNNVTIFVTNINIPNRYLDNVRPILEQVYNFINREYANLNEIQYQLTATYLLKNTETQEIRQWAGSFMPRQNNLSSIDSFHYYGPNFVNRVERLCDRASIGAKLLLHNVDTKWEFESLTSVVINFQASVPEDFLSLSQRNLRLTRYGRRRNHTTFLLP